MKKHLIITGGLGNQMFEYALFLALKKKGHKAILDISYYDFFKMHNGFELNRVFGINGDIINKQGLHLLWLRFLHKIKPSSLYLADSLIFNIQAIINPPRYIWGYWQDERYFKEIEKEVRDAFQFQGIDKKNLAIAEGMQKANSISLHIRRGDYASFGMTLLGEDYYKRAIMYMKKFVDSPYYYIFSDDENVAKNIVKDLGIEYKIITHNTGIESYKDMFLMSKCKHNIIANSSFSWWGAWLNKYDNKIVVAPKVWDSKHIQFHPQPGKWQLI